MSILLLAIGCSKSNNPEAINPPVDPSTKVNKILLGDSAALLLPDQQIQLSVDITPSTAINKKVQWKSSNTSIATVDDNGLVKAVSNGRVSITVTSQDNVSITDTARLVVLKNYDVHAVGNGVTSRFYSQAVYWNNETPNDLPGGHTVGIKANAIKIVGNDIYIAGATSNENGWAIPTFWKNGSPTQLTDPSNQFAHFITGLEVNNQDVYVTGYDFQMVGCPNCQYVSHGHYWKTSGGHVTDVPLYEAGVSTGAMAVQSINSKIYVAGWQANDNFFRMSKLWTDNFSSQLEFSRGSFASGNTIATKGSTIYVGGFDGCPYTNCSQIAKLWKSDGSNPIQFTDGTHEATINAMAFQDDDLILAGYEKNAAGKYVAKYWRLNGSSFTTHTIGSGDTDSGINGLTIVGDEIFFAGYETDKVYGYRQSIYWRVIDNLSLAITLYSATPGSGNAELNGIAVR